MRVAELARRATHRLTHALLACTSTTQAERWSRLASSCFIVWCAAAIVCSFYTGAPPSNAWCAWSVRRPTYGTTATMAHVQTGWVVGTVGLRPSWPRSNARMHEAPLAFVATFWRRGRPYSCSNGPSGSGPALLENLIGSDRPVSLFL